MTTSAWTVETVLEDYISERKLSRRKLAFLEQFHKHQLHGAVGDMIGFLPTAPAHICEALDLQSGCTWAGVVAELLDHIHSEKNGHKVTLHTWQLENSTTEEPPAIVPESKIVNEENVLKDFIRLKKMSSLRRLFLTREHEDRLRRMEYQMVHGNDWNGEFLPCQNEKELHESIEVIKGLNDLAKEKGYPKELDDCFIQYDLATAFALDLINWIEKDQVYEDELTEEIDRINNCMTYFGKKYFPF